VFVTESRTRPRILRAAGAAIAVLAILWLVALGFSLTGLGPLSKIDLPGVPGPKQSGKPDASPDVDRSSPAAGLGAGPVVPDGSEATALETLTRPAQRGARAPGSSVVQSPAGPQATTPSAAGGTSTGSATQPTKVSPASRKPATSPVRAHGTAKVTPGDAHSQPAPGSQTAPGQERKALRDSLTSP
jgi:hypothetical protein